MTFTNLTDYMCQIASQIKNVNSFYVADVYDCWIRHDVKYSSVAVYLQSAVKENNVITYDILMYYGDRLVADGSNRDSIFDDGIRALMTLLDNLPAEVEYSYPVTYTTFEQAFADNLAGVYASVQIDCLFDQGKCGLSPLDEIEEADL